MPLGYANNDGANALDQQQELDFFRGWSVVDAASGSNLVTTGTGSYDVDVAAGDIHTPSGSVSASAATLDLQALVDPDLPRIVIVYRDSGGTVQSLAGTPAPKDDAGKTTPAELFQPAPESFDATDGVVLATVLLEAGASEVTSAQIRDRRLPSEVRAESGVFESLSVNTLDSDSVSTDQADIINETYIEASRSNSISDASGWTNIVDTEDADVKGELNSSQQFVPAESGRYRIYGNTWVTPSNDGDVIAVRLSNEDTGGDVTPRLAQVIVGGVADVGIPFVDTFSLSAGTPYEVQVRNFSGTYDLVSNPDQFSTVQIEKQVVHPE